MILYMNITTLLLGGSLVFYSLSPYYSALGLVMTAISGCSLLAQTGTSFLALMLLLVYLGGMLVVFTYSSAVSADRFPSIKKTTEVFVLTFFMLLWTTTLKTKKKWKSTKAKLNMSKLTDMEGASYLFHQNLVMLFMLAGYMLLMALMVVLNMSRMKEEAKLQPL